ncbi:unnamed protein product, partial [Rotaria socialis]
MYVRGNKNPNQTMKRPMTAAQQIGWWTKDEPLKTKEPWTQEKRHVHAQSEMTKFVDDMHTNVIHTDFLDYTPLLNLFENHQACIWALGISQNAVNETEYIKITHDYTLAAAKSIANVNPTMRFIFISGMGADSTEQSRFLFGRIKGKTENDLVKESGLKEIYTVRPAGIIFTEQPSNKPWYERAFTPALHVFKVIKPAWVITAIGLSRTILYLVKNGHHATLFENQDLR